MYVQRVDGDAWIEEYRPDVEQPSCYLVMGRLGGDEFILAGPVSSPEEARIYLGRMVSWALARFTG